MWLFRRSDVAIVLFILIIAARITPMKAQSGVLTYHNDNARTGQNLNEAVLTPANVNQSAFGKLFSYGVDGYVYAQPLFVPSVNFPGVGPRNAVYVATEHDSVYAFDAESAASLWQVNFLGPGVTTIPGLETDCDQILPEIGITATPVIDPASGTIYVVAVTKEDSVGGGYVHRLHALDLSTGAERSGSPVVIQASAPGSDGGTITFNPRSQNERSGLLLLNGVVYTAWSSHCDIAPYHGWLIGYDARTLAQVSVYITTPSGSQAAIWGGGAGPAVDAQGNIFIATGNGSFDADRGGQTYGDSFVKLTPRQGGMSAVDYFAPSNQAILAQDDEDLGSGGVLVVPDSAGNAAHPHLLVGAGKQGRIYLVDRDNMGRFDLNTENNLQTLNGVIRASFGTPAYFNNTLYYGGSGDPLQAFTFSGAALSATASSRSPKSFAFPGTTPSLSSNGTSNGIVWAIENAGQAVLHAYAAEDLSRELYNSARAGGQDDAGRYVKFSVPTIANGRVYVGGQSSVAVFGLLPQAQPAGGLVNAASFSPGPAAPGEIASFFAGNLTDSIEMAPSTPLPEILAGAAVSVTDSSGLSRPASLFFASPSQINMVLPQGIALGPASILISGPAERSTRANVLFQKVSPGLFTASPKGQGLAAAMYTRVRADGSQTTQPAFQCGGGGSCAPIAIDLGPEGDQVFLILFGTGIRNASGLSGVQVVVGGANVAVSFAGPQGGNEGLDQINALLPRSLMGAGTVDVKVTIDGQTANTVNVQIR